MSGSPTAKAISPRNRAGGQSSPSHRAGGQSSPSHGSRTLQRAATYTASSTDTFDTEGSNKFIPNDNTPIDLEHLRGTFKTPIVGDVFGSRRDSEALNGLMYRARVLESKNLLQEDQDELNFDEDHPIDSVESYTDTRESDNESEDDYQHFKMMNPKQQLALTVKNWSLSPANDKYIIKEGGVEALIALCHVEDAFIRRCCASSFYHLSNREDNRQSLLNTGGTNGIALCLQGSPPRCPWKVARLCAMSLCNLSMVPHGEATMANENAAVVLVQLSTYMGTALLPICVQALYNLSCSAEHFKGIERIIKAFLNMSSSGFDHSVHLVRSLVNCARYSWLRLRIIEDGALSSMNALIQGLANNEHRTSLVYDMLTALRSLSDSVGCRADMLAKGAVDMLNNLLPYCDDSGRLQVMKILHNFLQAPPSSMNNTSFETSVLIATLIVGETCDPVIIQYCSACFHIITKEHIRGMRHLAMNIIDSMSVLLQAEDPLTQFFAISSAGNLFFNNLCDTPSKVEQLVLNFVEHGPGINDPAANQALALALAKLSQEPSYMAVIVKLRLLHDVLELLLKLLDLHRNSLLLQESCCIAICRISLKIEAMDLDEKQRIASVFVNMLETDDRFVLQSTVSGIRALGSSGLCPKELLSDMLLNRIAAIVDRYSGVTELCRTGCAVLAVFSYDIEAHDLLAAENIMKVLFANIKAEDDITRELVATSLCNVSVNSLASNMMIQMGVVSVLANLSSSTSENILELCAKCICNLTCNVNLHPKMLENKVLEIILMISLVRTVSHVTKLICAKALLNLVTDLNLSHLENSGAVRVFATLSTINNGPIQQICSKGFYLLTLNTQRRLVTVSSRMVLQSLYSMVKSSSSRTRVRIGTSVCNLLSCASTNKAAIYAGALSVLKIIATMDFEELRENTARVVINLAEDESLKELLLQQPLVEILVLTLHQSHGYTFECGIMAMSCLAQSKVFKTSLIERGGVTALISCVLTGKVRSAVMAEEVCRCLCHLSYSHDYSERMVSSGHLIMALQVVYLTGLCSADTALLIALTLRNLSESLASRKHIMSQDGFKLAVSLLTDFTSSRYKCTVIYSALVTFVYNLSLVQSLHTALVEQGLMKLLKQICLFSNSDFDTDAAMNTTTATNAATATDTVTATDTATASTTATAESKEQNDGGGSSSGSSSSSNAGAEGEAVGTLLQRMKRRPGFFFIEQEADEFFESLLHFTYDEVKFIAKTINLISQTPSCHVSLVEGGVMDIFKALIVGLSKDVSARNEVSAALANLAASKHCRTLLVKQNALELLIALSRRADVNTQAQCAVALGFLSELTAVHDGVVSSLLSLSLSLEESNVASGSSPVDPASSSLITHGRRPVGETGAAAGVGAGVGAGGVSLQADAKAVLSQLQVPQSANSESNLQTLSSLLKGVLIDKTKFEAYLSALEENSKLNSSTNQLMRPVVSEEGPDSAVTAAVASQENEAPHNGTKLNVDDAHADKIAAEEVDVLRCHYDRYRLEQSESHEVYESESGGMSMKLLMELPLPGIPADRDLDPLDRHTELTKITISEAPLPKDVKVPHAIETRPSTVAEQQAAVAAAAEKEAEELRKQAVMRSGQNSTNSSRPATPGEGGGGGRKSVHYSASSKGHRDTIKLRRTSTNPNGGINSTGPAPLPEIASNTSTPPSSQRGTRPSILRKSSTHHGHLKAP